MSSLGDPEERMRVVRSVRLRPDQYRKHWGPFTPTTKSGHIRDRLDFADEAEKLFLRILDKSVPCSGELYYEVKRLMEAEHGR